ncbi:MAG: ABC transporter ATP-binding protein [Desulfovibrionales bacterium]|nr:ABC transporter ATP-binding protein [Desulfovibrionales bacterium]
MIQLNNISKSFPVTGKVLERFSLHVEQGAFLVLYGPSASGKSTILNLIAGLDAPDNGTLLWFGANVPPGIGYQFQNYESTLFPWLTNAANIELPLRVNGTLNVVERQQRVNQTVERLRLQIPLKSQPFKLSGGGKQKIALARALVSHPQILLLDEPFNSLDLNDREFMHQEIVRIWREFGLTIIFVTHDLDEALIVGQKLVIIGGKPAQIIGEPFPINMPYPRDAKVKMSEDYFRLRVKALELFERAKNG